MSYLNPFDHIVILLYLLVLVGLGVYLQKRASKSLQDYFLGGKTLPWWALGVSGMASYFDVAGTMLITSFLFMLGPRGMYIEFRGAPGSVCCCRSCWCGLANGIIARNV